MTASIFARVSLFTNGDWLMTRETVFFETLARRAMSLIVARRPSGISADSAGAGRRAPEGLGFAMSFEFFGLCWIAGMGRRQSTRSPGLDKRRLAPFNDTGFHRENRPAWPANPAGAVRTLTHSVRHVQNATSNTASLHLVAREDDVAV